MWKCTRKQDKYTHCVLPRQLHLENILMQMRHYLIKYAHICIIFCIKSQSSKFYSVYFIALQLFATADLFLHCFITYIYHILFYSYLYF